MPNIYDALTLVESGEKSFVEKGLPLKFSNKLAMASFAQLPWALAMACVVAWKWPPQVRRFRSLLAQQRSVALWTF
jgi:hypothetical protein